jgi:class 3 adenylate cyclase
LFKFIRSISLKALLIFSFTIVAVTTTCILGVSVLLLTKSYFRSELNNRLNNISQTAAFMIDSEAHRKLINPEDEESANYQTVRQVLLKIKTANPDLRYIYTMRRINGKIQFVVDAEIDPANRSHLGDAYDVESKGLSEAFDNPGRIVVEKDFITDNWGTWLSAFAPIITSEGTFDGLVGVDVAAESIVQQETQLRNLVLICSLLAILFSILIGVYLANKISGSLTQLAEDILKVRTFDLSGEGQTINSSINEIKEMSHAVDSMKKGLRSFKKYVPADLVVELLKIRKEAELGTDKRDITLMFTDIVDFTNISEKISPDELSKNLGQYLQQLSEAIKKNNGTIDKYIGDAIMAFWGAPNEVPNHAKAACYSVLECLNLVSSINLDLARRGYPPFKTRFGIHSGSAIVGNIGHTERLSYTAIGDNVNLASRIESINKAYGTEVLISEATYNEVKDEFVARAVDQVILKGKTQPLKIYQLIGVREGMSHQVLADIEAFNNMMELYFSGNISEAQKIMTKIYEIDPTDKVAQNILDAMNSKLAEGHKQGFSPTIMREK